MTKIKAVVHRDNDSNYIVHYGVKGMKWKIQKAVNEASDKVQDTVDNAVYDAKETTADVKTALENARDLRKGRIDPGQNVTNKMYNNSLKSQKRIKKRNEDRKKMAIDRANARLDSYNKKSKLRAARDKALKAANK